MERKWWTLLAVCTAIFMLLLDITIVNVALPDIERSLNASFSELQWVVDAYALTLAGLLLTAGVLGDQLGRRRVFGVGFALFTIASLLCGLAPSAVALDVARALQGIGGAVMFATSLALIAQEFHGADRATAFGIWGATTGGAVAIGPLVGGIITESLGWEWIFFVNVPVGAAAIWLTFAKLRDVRSPHPGGIDWGGLVTFSGALFALVFALIRANAEGWASPLILGLFVASAALLAAFLAIESRHPEPMFDLSLFRKPTFVGASIAAFALSASMFAMFLYLTLYLQSVLGSSPLEAGVRFLPITLLSFFVAPVAGKLSERLPVRGFLGGGLALVGVGLLLMHGLTVDSSWTALLPGFILAGAGIGMINPPLASTAIGVVEPRRSGMASGINTTFRQVGIATGIAALGAVFQHRVAAELTDRLAGTSASGRVGQLAQAVAGGGSEGVARRAPAGTRQALEEASRAAFVSGLNEILLIGAGVAIVGAVLSLVLVRRSDFVAAAEASPAAA